MDSWAGWVPGLGTAYSAYKAYTGQDMWGRCISNADRWANGLSVAAAAVPLAAKGAGKLAGKLSSRLNRVRAACMGNNCFPAGTPVSVVGEDGKESVKTIETVKAGEQVVSRDPVSGKTQASKVKQTFVRQAPALVTVTLCDPQSGKPVQTVSATPEHPFFTPDGAVELGKLGIGSTVLTRRGPPLVVSRTVWEAKPGRTAGPFLLVGVEAAEGGKVSEE